MREKRLLGQERECVCVYYCHNTILLFLGFTFGTDSISEEVVRFSPLWFSLGKSLCILSIVFDCYVCSSQVIQISIQCLDMLVIC